MNFNVVYFYLLIALLGVLGIMLWLNKRNKYNNKYFYAIPLVIIMVISGILVQETISMTEKVHTDFLRQEQQILDNKWEQVKNQIISLQNENFKDAEEISDEIINKLKNTPSEILDEDLRALKDYDSDNTIINTVNNAIKDKYFRNIISDSNDPFVMAIGPDIENTFVFANNSQIAASDKNVTSSSQEFQLFQNMIGDTTLIKHAFDRIFTLKPNDTFEDYIFIQIYPRDCNCEGIFSTEDLKELFMYNHGDIKKTFQGFEFLAVDYIYRNSSISGEARIEYRVKTDAVTLGVVSAFNYLEVLDRDELFKSSLKYYDDTLQHEKTYSELEAQHVLISGLLLMSLVYLLLVLFWVLMYTTQGDYIKENRK